MRTLKPPAELHYLTDVIGADAVLALIEALGGVYTYIPKTVQPESSLARAIGMQSAILLSMAFGGETMRIPICRHWRVKVYRQDGLSNAKIALKLGVGEGTVYRLKQHDSGFTQPDLFDPIS